MRIIKVKSQKSKVKVSRAKSSNINIPTFTCAPSVTWNKWLAAMQQKEAKWPFSDYDTICQILGWESEEAEDDWFEFHGADAAPCWIIPDQPVSDPVWSLLLIGERRTKFRACNMPHVSLNLAPVWECSVENSAATVSAILGNRCRVDLSL